MKRSSQPTGGRLLSRTKRYSKICSPSTWNEPEKVTYATVLHNLRRGATCHGGWLNEKYVQRVAVGRLASHYGSRPDVLSVLSETEVVVRTDSELGSGRADGVVAVLMSDGSVHTAARREASINTMQEC
jgi:hypothetical protein